MNNELWSSEELMTFWTHHGTIIDFWAKHINPTAKISQHNETDTKMILLFFKIARHYNFTLLKYSFPKSQIVSGIITQD